MDDDARSLELTQIGSDTGEVDGGPAADFDNRQVDQSVTVCPFCIAWYDASSGSEHTEWIASSR